MTESEAKPKMFEKISVPRPGFFEPSSICDQGYHCLRGIKELQDALARGENIRKLLGQKCMLGSV